MRLLLPLLFLCMVAGSCQQRYGHVKKVREKNAEVVRLPSDAPAIPRDVQIVHTDSILEEPTSPGVAEPIAVDELPVEEPKRQKLSFPKRQLVPVTAGETVFSQILRIPDTLTEDTPKETFLMLAVFFVWLVFLSYSASVIITIIAFALFFSIDFATGAFSLAIPSGFAVIVIITFLLAWVLAYFIGKRRIEKKLGYSPPLSSLVRNYFIAFGVTMVLNFIGLLPGFIISATATLYANIAGITILVLFVSALIYSWVFKYVK